MSNEQNAFSNFSGTRSRHARWASRDPIPIASAGRARRRVGRPLARRAAAPAPAPASQVIAAIRASEAQAAELAPSPAARIRHGLIHADRLTGPLARLDPARLDPRLAEHLLGR
jgi:hypothetical protein